MVKAISEDSWLRYKALCPDKVKPGTPLFPRQLSYQGEIVGPFDYVLPEGVLDSLRTWLRQGGEQNVFYFLTESVRGEKTDFDLEVDELTKETLARINHGNENLIVGGKFTWALFVDHEGSVHVAGSRELFVLIQQFENLGERG